MKRKEVKGEVDILRTPLDLYREYRGLSITELAMEAGISRQAVNMACLGMKVGMERLSRLAKVLHVDVEDLDQNVMPEGMKRHMVYIPGIMDAIRETIKRCPPCKLRGKADVIAAYLAAEDQDTEDVVGYLVNRCGTFGYQYLNFYLSKKHKKTESRNEKITEERKMDKCSLALYREYRDMNVNELADASGISRQSISAACSGSCRGAIISFLDVRSPDRKDDRAGHLDERGCVPRHADFVCGADASGGTLLQGALSQPLFYGRPTAV